MEGLRFAEQLQQILRRRRLQRLRIRQVPQIIDRCQRRDHSGLLPTDAILHGQMHMGTIVQMIAFETNCRDTVR